MGSPLAGAASAMDDQTPYLELACPACSWTEVCAPEAVARWLRKAGKLRSRQAPELEIMHEVLRATAGQSACPECGRRGLIARSAAEDTADWSVGKRCTACGNSISKERLQAVPGAVLCAACQRGEELGRAPAHTEYCPRCGALMRLRASKTGGLTRYVLACTNDPPCRL